MSRPMSPQLQRAHLEALALAYVLQDPIVADELVLERLSPAAAAWVEYAADDNVLARAHLGAADPDLYRARLARRTLALTVEQLLFFPRETVVALVNQLPVIGARGAHDAHAERRVA